MVMTNLITGDKVVLYFQLCGWFGYEVDGYVYDAVEEPKILMTGKWNESMSCQPCDQEGEPLPGTELKEVHFAATKDTLSRYFNKFGEVLKVIIVNDAATGQPRGSAYVEFLRKESAESALSLNGTYFLSRSLKIVNVSEQKPINILAVVAGLPIAQIEMKREGINNEVLDDAVPLAWEAPLVVCAATNSVGRRDALRRPIANSAGRTGVTLRRSIARMQTQFGDIAELNT